MEKIKGTAPDFKWHEVSRESLKFKNVWKGLMRIERITESK